MTKADLRTGMFGIDRAGRVFTVVNDTMVYQDGGCSLLRSYNDDLVVDRHSGYDIMKICEANGFNDARANFYYNRKLLLDRTVPTRMTIAEIKQKLGIENLEIVE